jgi:uncharacterized protein
MKIHLISLVSGIIFAIGLSISGMVNPNKVKGFLDIFGNWDYSLAFVMGGAVLFNLASFKYLLTKKPYIAEKHEIPKSNLIDKKLLIGASLFGIGWGLVGICPGPAISNLVTLNLKSILFVFSMLIGMLIYKKVITKD